MPIRKPLIFISNIEWAKQVLLAHLLISYIASSEESISVFLIDISNGLFRLDILENVAKRFNIKLDNRVKITNTIKDIPKHKGLGLFIYNISVNKDECFYAAKMWHDLAKFFLVVSDIKPSKLTKFKRVYGTRIYINRLTESQRLFTLKSYEREVKVIIDYDGVYDYELRLYGNLKLVYEVIREAIIEYGPLDLKDIIPVIISKTGLKKGVIQKYIRELVKMGLIRIIGKTVTIS